MPIVAMEEKIKLGEFHMFGVTVTYTDDEADALAAESGIKGDNIAEGLQRVVEKVMYEERKILVSAAIKSGVLDLQTAKDILKAWTPAAEKKVEE